MKTKFVLALWLGWALMYPLNNNDGQDAPNLKTWIHSGSFDTARECENQAYGQIEAEKTKKDKESWLRANLFKCMPIEMIYKVK